MAGLPGKVDVHHHIIPDFYKQVLSGIDLSAKILYPSWTPEASLAFMDNHHIDTAILSLSAPGASIAGSRDNVRALVRRWNNYAYELCSAYPKRFGFFAALPGLHDLDGAISEIKYVFDSIKADGVTLFTSYDGHYLGSKAFEPIWAELDKTCAVVHVHPNHSFAAPFTTPFLPQPFIDYPHETGRTASDLVLSGRKRQFPSCKVILSHAGGTLPYLADRISVLSETIFAGILDAEHSPRGGEQVMEDLKSFYFDLALGGSSTVLDLLVNWAPRDHILYGSDYPFAGGAADRFDAALESYSMDSQGKRMCYQENALDLFPRLRLVHSDVSEAESQIFGRNKDIKVELITMIYSNDLPSAAFFNPQANPVTGEYLDCLRSYLQNQGRLRPLVDAIRTLPQTWEIYAHHRIDLASLAQGLHYAKLLADWIDGGNSVSVATAMSGCCALPLLTIVQIGQYFQFLDLKGTTHHQLLECLKTGGVHGYCGGLLPAIAVALSHDEAELAQNASIVLRIAMGIGAYGDLGDEGIEGGFSNMAIRLKCLGQGEEIVQLHPGSHISAVTDPRTISVVGPTSLLEQIEAFAATQGLRSQRVHIRGKVHNPENTHLAADLESLCLAHNNLRLPSPSKLKVPFRSNMHGEVLKQSLLPEIIKTVLTSRCDWYQLLGRVAIDLSRSERHSHNLINFGTGDCLSLVPFRQLGLTITKSNVMTLIKDGDPAIASSHQAPYTYSPGAIAVVGMGCRLPGANNVEELWELMSSGKSTVQKLRQDRVNTEQNFRITLDKKSAGREEFYGNFIDCPDAFDHSFFGMTAREAIHMDPQQRLLLQISYQAVESSGHLRTHQRENGDNVGVFIGNTSVDYLSNTSSHTPSAYTSTGTLGAFLSGRISHHFGWTGPSEVVDTACSSSLVAINRACKAIQHGECSLALAGGVNVISGIDNYLDLGKAGFLSTTGQCKPFANDADGYCRAEGVGLVFLKSLDQALRENDRILGVVCGSGSNQGGLSSSITVPHSPTQIALYRRILDQAGLKPSDVSYVEAHGTGTPVGDPLEITSIREAFGGRDRETTLHVGSIKGNIGHCETAAGVAGFIKAILMLQKGAIPPLTSHKVLNSKIPDLKLDHMAVASSKQEWSVAFRAICVNSYGAAGSNAAMIVCQPPPLPSCPPADGSLLCPFLLSAQSEASLIAYAKDLHGWLQGPGSQLAAAHVAFTLAERRQHHRFRWAFTSRDLKGLLPQLASNQPKGMTVGNPRSVVLVFCGQIGRAIGLNQTLYETCELFRSNLDRCNRAVRLLGIPSLIPAIFQVEPIPDLRLLHCCLFAQQYACAQSWIESGLQVAGLVGQSFGELTALAVAGILSLEDALALIVARASLVQSHWGHEQGRMLAVRCTLEATNRIIAEMKQLGKEVEIACHNAEDNHVLGGTEDAISATERLLLHEPRHRSVKAQRLDVTHAYHTKLTDPLLPALEEAVAMLDFKTPQIPLTTCTRDGDHVISPSYINSHLRDPVYFQAAVRRLETRLGSCVWLEAGSDSSAFAGVNRATAYPARHIFQTVKFDGCKTPMDTIASITANLWQQGIDLSFWGFHSQHLSLQQVWLPPYHFQETRHWLPYVDHAMVNLQRTITSSHETTQSRRIDGRRLVARLNSEPDDNLERFEVDTSIPRYVDIVSGHLVLGQPLCPAGTYIECVHMATQLLLDDQTTHGGLALDDCTFEHPLGLDPNRALTLQLRKRQSHAAWSFEVSSRPRGQQFAKSSIHAKGRISYGNDIQLQRFQRLISRRVDQLHHSANTESLRKDRAYMVFSRVVNYSDIFRGISSIKFADTEALAHVTVPFGAPRSESSSLKTCDTISLDVFVQVSGLLINSHSICPEGSAYLAVGVDSIRVSDDCDLEKCKDWTVYAILEPAGHSKAKGDVFVMCPSGELVIAMNGIQFSKVPFNTLEKLLTSPDEASRRKKHDDTTAQQLTPEPASPTHPRQLTNLMLPVQVSEASSRPQQGDPHCEADGQSLENLRTIVGSYVGLPGHQITDDTSLGAIGIDSLATIELADELSAKYGVPVAANLLLEADVLTLCRRLGISQSSIPVEKARIPLTASTAAQAKLQLAPPRKFQEYSVRPKLTEILSQYSGCRVPAIADEVRLVEMGIDSLAKIELVADIEASFHFTVDDHVFSPESTVKDIIRLINKTIDTSGHASLEDAVSSSTSLTSMVPTPDSSEMHKAPGTLRPPTINVDPVQILADCNPMFSSSAQDHGFTRHWDVIGPKHDEIVLAYIVEAFAYLGSDLRTFQPDEHVPSIDFQPRHSHVVRCLWDILERQEAIYRKSGSTFRTSKRIANARSSQLTRDYIGWHPRYTVDFALMALTGPVLADCLTGATDPLKILFGNSKAQQVLDDFYHESPMLATMTDQLVAFIKQAIARTSPDVDIRIVEIGAGFGGTTTALAQMLQQSNRSVGYTFTDIAPTLVDKARKKFSEYAWMDFGTMNLDQDPPVKYRGRYDIVIATNVVHATKDLVASASRLKSLLREGGFICLSEITKTIDWHNIVFGLLPGWWSFTDGRTYALQSAEEWMTVFKKAGFVSTGYSTGPSEEAKTQQLLVGSTRARQKHSSCSDVLQDVSTMNTVVYKVVDDTEIHADIYLPNEPPIKPMPIALMIHGGGYMTLSRKAIRPLQTRYLLQHGILPISLDHRLCPKVNIIDGPMADIRDAITWARCILPSIALDHGISIDTSKIAVIGWSTGGHLAMTAAWTTTEAGIEPPTAILNFYGPSDFEALSSHHDQHEGLPRTTPSNEDISKWLGPSDPRTDLVLSLFKNNSAANLSLLLPSETATATKQHHLNAINPLHQLQTGNYNIPTFIVHGSDDEIIPHTQSIIFQRTMKEKGLESGVLIVEGAKHIHDVGIAEGNEMWEKGVGPGYDFLLKYLLPIGKGEGV
ncbi:MAG: hypothetical protein Q9169_002625 [Polycauliona sp. 2 TL-2023]